MTIKSHELKTLNIRVTLEELPQAKDVTLNPTDAVPVSSPNTNNDQQSAQDKKAALDIFWNTLIKDIDALESKQRKE